MTLRPRKSDQSSEFDPLNIELNRQALLNERSRSGFLVGAFTALLAWMAILRVIYPNIGYGFGRNLSPFVVGGILAFAALCELVLWFYFGAVERNGQHLAKPARYVSAALEVTIPSAVCYYVSTMGPPIYSLLGPPVFVYFILIILSALRLDTKICLFTGCVAAAEYGVMAYRALEDAKLSHLQIDPLLTAPLHHVGKTIIMILAGFIAGRVTRQLRRHVRAAAHTVQERDRVVELFGRHVSPEVVKKLLAQPNSEGELRRVCVMFLDIRNFTGYSEGRDPAEVVRFLNQLFAPLIDCVNRHQGIINKFLGDGFMAVFGAPLDDTDAAKNAVRASRQMLAAVAQLHTEGKIPPTRIGIGLHLGEAVTGIVGSADRKEYTIIGDVVNLASRIEGLNKQFGSQLLVSSAVREQSLTELADATSRGSVPIKGRADAVEIFQAA